MNFAVVTLFATVVLLGNAASADAQRKPKQIKIRGYVTNVLSPTQFEIEDYRITRDQAFALEFENDDGALRFRPEDIQVGVALEIKGFLDESSNTLRPTSIKVDLDQFKKAKHTAVIAYPPVGVSRGENGWSGLFVADGQRIQVTPTTEVLFKLTSRERKLAKRAAKTENEDDDDAFEPLRSLDQVTAGMLMSYEGPRKPDGTIIAERVEFSRNDLEKGEEKLWKSLTVEVKSFGSTKPPELKINRVGKFRLVADEDVQTYVSQLGQALIPAHQRDLPGADPTKLNFRFFVVDDKQINAFALPNGIVVVNSAMFAMLENEAQLAAVVGHEIAHATQEHSWRQSQFHKKKRIAIQLAAAFAAAYGKHNVADLLAMTLGAIQNGYSRSLENQADRVGMEYMVAAGYDPRQAPQVWKSMTKATGLHATNFFWSSHDNHATRRSYLMNELRMNHADLDYARLKTDADEFHRMQARVVAVSREKLKLRVRHSSPTTRLGVEPVSNPAPPPRITQSRLRVSELSSPPSVGVVPAGELPPVGTASASQRTPKAPGQVMVVKGAPIYLIPDANRSPLYVTPDESMLRLIEQMGEWYRVEFNDRRWGARVGFVHQQHVTAAGK